jgi:hypothetical protein
MTGEIIKPLIRLAAGESYTAKEDGAHVITAEHTHSDILRFVIADLGASEARFLIDGIEAEAPAT